MISPHQESQGRPEFENLRLSLTDDQKLQIIDELIQEISLPSIKNGLKVVISDDPMLPFSTVTSTSRVTGDKSHHSQLENLVHTYELIGSKTARKTQNFNILQKLDILQKDKASQESNVSPSKKLEDKPETHDQGKDNPTTTTESEKEIYRYFTPHVKCFRCKQIGHYDYACVNEFSCNYCLSPEHHSERCLQKTVCFRCYRYGHMLNQCPQKEEGEYCQNCKRRHIGSCNFLMKGTEQIKQMFPMDDLYNDPQIRCLKCFSYGHFNCQTVEGTHQSNSHKRYHSDRVQTGHYGSKYGSNINGRKKYKY